MPEVSIADSVTGVAAEVELGVRRYREELDRDRLQRRMMLLSVLLPSLEGDEHDAVATERSTVRSRLAAYDGLGSVDDHEPGFMHHAATFAQDLRITVSSWSAMGVPDAVMIRAGLAQRRGRDGSVGG